MTPHPAGTVFAPLLLLAAAPHAGTPIEPDAAAVAKYAAMGSTVREADVPAYELPPLPRMSHGAPDRAAMVQTLRREMFGTVPDLSVSHAVAPGEPVALPDGGEAVYHRVRLSIAGDAGEGTAAAHLFRPVGDGPFPCFVFMDHRSNASADPSSARKLWIEGVIAAGFALVAVPSEGIAPDVRNRDFDSGIHALVSGPRDPEWGTLAAWAWGMSKTREAVQSLPEIGACFAIGHSRGGKAALWASATDEEFAGVVSNNSGCGGAALSRRRIGETVAIINRVLPHWYNTRFKAYADREAALPFDQHWLIAASAPRGAAVASASRDYWADPYGEWLALKAAAPAWGERVAADLGDVPAVGGNRDAGPLHYHLREGNHDLRPADWRRYFAWARRVLAADGR